MSDLERQFNRLVGRQLGLVSQEFARATVPEDPDFTVTEDTQQPTPRALRILTLDGGGVKGLAELRILERLFRTIRDEHRKKGMETDELPLPCEYFDIIGGTSTGGLIAIMLGRLRMTIPQAIEHFKALSKEVFPGDKSWEITKLVKGLLGTAYFDGQHMEAAIKKLLKEQLYESPNMSFRESRDPQCKVFVCATRAQTAGAILLRSYETTDPGETDYVCEVWEAARATSAAPLFFAPFTIQRLGLTLVDGALRLNNPINEIISEAHRVYPGRKIGCLVSIGTGITDVKPLEKKGVKIHEIAKTCAQISMNCDEVAQEFGRSPMGLSLQKSGAYFRFDVQKQLDNVNLEDWRRLDDVDAFVDKYLRNPKVSSDMSLCANVLNQPRDNHDKIAQNSDLERIKLTMEEEDCLKSLSFPALNERVNNITPAAEGTCAWLLRHQTYRHWSGLHRGLLWIKGKPGSGKSTLLKYLLQYINSRPSATQNKEVVIFFFFHGRGHELERTVLGLYRSFLYQLLKRVPGAFPGLVEMFRSRCGTVGQPGEKWNWHPRELQDIFEFSLPKVLERYLVRIFVDALDEAGEETAVRLVKDFQRQIQKLPFAGSQCSFCFTCRHYPILTLDYGLVICVEVENEEDIATFVRAELTEDNHNRSGIANKIIARASGTFQWTLLVINRVLELERRGTSPKKIKDEIQSIPPDLENLYKDLFQDMSEDEKLKSLKLMRWICFATRPLSLDELRVAIALDPESSCKSQEDCENSDDYTKDNKVLERRIKTLSRGLAEIQQSYFKSEVQFIHQSVKDFFIQDGLRILGSNWRSTDLAIGAAHRHLFRSCIYYFSMVDIGEIIGIDSDWETKLPFLNYSIEEWISHAKMAEAKDISLAGLPDEIYRRCNAVLADDGMPLLCGVAHNGLISLLGDVLETLEPGSINGLDKRGKSALAIATESGNDTVVKLLLAHDDIDVNLQDKDGRTPMLIAVEKGYETVLELFLAHSDIDINLQDNGGYTPLGIAVLTEREKVVGALLAHHDVDVDSKTKFGCSPLPLAVMTGNNAIIDLLLRSRTATEDERIEILLLARRDIDIDVRNRYDAALLSWAATAGQESLFKLFQFQSNIKTRSEDDSEILSWAAERTGTLVSLLLPWDLISVNIKDDATLLSRAAAEGHEALVTWLKAYRDIDLSLEREGGRKLLSWAAQKDGTVAKLLLARSEVNIAGEDGSGVLHWAVAKEDEALVNLLLTWKDTDVNITDKTGRTPLSFAAEHGHDTLVNLLLTRRDVDVNLTDETGRTPLSFAAEQGHDTLVNLLLTRRDVDVNLTDRIGRTPLLFAVEQGYDTLVNLLLTRKDVNVNLADATGRTLLSFAAEQGHDTLVRVLLARSDIDINLRDRSFRSPYYFAIRGGHKAVSMLLRQHGGSL